MSTPNPFATATTSTTPAPVAAAPVAEIPTASVAAPVAPTSEEVSVDTKVKKEKKARTSNNKKMEEEDRLAIIRRYQNEDIGLIAQSMGYTRSQAYNVIRNTRILLTEEIEANPEMPADRRAQIDRILEMVKGKEFGRGAVAGAVSKTSTEKVSDILASLLG